MDGRESLGVLGLEEGATRTEVEAAFTRLRALHRLSPECVPPGKELWRLREARNKLLRTRVPVLRLPRLNPSAGWRRPLAACAGFFAPAAALLLWALSGTWDPPSLPGLMSGRVLVGGEKLPERRDLTAPLEAFDFTLYPLDADPGSPGLGLRDWDGLRLFGDLLPRSGRAGVFLGGCGPAREERTAYSKCSIARDYLRTVGVPFDRIGMDSRRGGWTSPVLLVLEPRGASDFQSRAMGSISHSEGYGRFRGERLGGSERVSWVLMSPQDGSPRARVMERRDEGQRALRELMGSEDLGVLARGLLD